ncbi:hypothetical protein F2Q68_00036103 [Brassica cretica]|uniref:Protein kinase domain-containing protein n=1 Tax=Brassica cretica TaxID=69181 RepID=A0A8S9H1L3_BRACR|nr:hypothetical protein F2Q68_00036103 [Brassica cretica]
MNLVKRNEDKGEETIGDLKLSLDTQLGSKSSKVFLGRFKNRDVAAKRSLIIKKGNLEIDRLSSYDSHPNIVSSKQTGGRKSAADPDLIDLMQGKQLWDANSNPSETLINLMKNIAYALDFLHTLKVVHTAINPENILVTDSLTAKLSRLGDIILISEELVSSTFLSSSSNLGWRPVDKSVTYALDMFSFGCILFYSLSGGLHPFGDEKNCVKHIASNQPSLSEINHLPEAKQLVRGLLNSNPESHPSASEVLKHPIFWSTDKKIQLIVEASDHFTAVPAFLQNLTATERKITTALAKKWVSQVDGNVLNSMRSKYRDNDFGELVRFFRNCKCHYSDIMIDIKGSIVSIQTVMGDMPDGFHSYFASRFPELLMHFLWRALSGAFGGKCTSKITRHVCGYRSETICHVLFHCSVAKDVWQLLGGLPLPRHGLSSNRTFLNLHYLVTCSRNKASNDTKKRKFLWILWHVWKAGNLLHGSVRKGSRRRHWRKRIYGFALVLRGMVRPTSEVQRTLGWVSQPSTWSDQVYCSVLMVRNLAPEWCSLDPTGTWR